MTPDTFTQACLALFALVDAKYPMKGVETLLRRAEIEHQQTQQPLNMILQRVYQEAEGRTYARLALLGQCGVSVTTERANTSATLP